MNWAVLDVVLLLLVYFRANEGKLTSNVSLNGNYCNLKDLMIFDFTILVVLLVTQPLKFAVSEKVGIP